MQCDGPASHDGSVATSADGFRCVEIIDPDPDELARHGTEFGLHDLAIEDAVHAHQRPKLERYGHAHLLVLKAVRYDDEPEELRFRDVILAFGPDFVLSVGHRRSRGGDTVADPGRYVHCVVDEIVDMYEPVMDELDADVREIEATVFGPSGDNPTARIYSLKREMVELLRNIRPLLEPLAALHRGHVAGVDPDLRSYFRDVHDHLQQVVLRAENASELLTEVLDANLTQVSLRQNEDMRKMSAWAAIFLLPTLLAGVWGMNFAHMPELDWRVGYPLALATMVAASTGLYFRFKRIGWL